METDPLPAPCTFPHSPSSSLLVRFLRTLQIPALAIALIATAPASDLAENLFKAGQKAERAGDTLHAYLLYVRAAQADPRNATYAARKLALQGLTTLSAKTTLGPDPVEVARATPPALDTDDPDSDDPASDDPKSDESAVDPNADPNEPPAEAVTAAELKEAREALPPPHLAGSPDKKTFDIKGDARMVFERVASAYGITVIFDQDYQAVQPFTFRMNDADYREALHGLEAVSDSFLIPLGPKLALVCRDTAQKRTEREPVAAVLIPIPERLSIQEAQELVQAVQTTLEIRRIATDPTKHVIFMRDRASKIMAAQQILASLSRARTQIEVEVEFIEVAKTSSLGYGLNLPNEISLVNFGNFLHNAATPAGFTKFLTFGGGFSLFGMGITDAAAFATVAKATANNLLRAQVISLDGQPVSLHVGTHYPVITNAYVGNTNTSTNGSSQVFTPPPTINFEDLGLVLKITPAVHGDDEVTLDVDAEFKVLGASTAVGIPIISNRKFTGKVRLKDGEWAVIAGLLTNLDSDSLTSYPGIGHVPFFGRLLGQTSIEKDSGQVLLVLKPRLLNLPPWEFPNKTIWVGTDTRPLTLF